ncbi:hypothetical protein FBU59_002385 [Linderina macrospora]|uniref:Uncharacterized protein n=1 Tax=Linderina macrospora TaxID=4868 RepID=A0ACC1JB65_9FUNG|nr:hypothetical protein FBU59_002385 [Linderina macrospora]
MVQYLLALLALRMFPHLRPTQSPTWGAYLSRAVPCGVASALDVGLSNVSLQTITLTFYTMCKSSSLGFVLLFAFLFGLERVRLVLIAIIAVISVGVMLMAAGEVNFVWAGFLEVMTSSAMSGLRWSLTQILLSQERFGMNNPVATMSKLTPIIGVSIMVFSLIIEHPFTEISKNKNMDTTQGTIMIVCLMMAGGVLAFSMVLSEFFLISRTSVVTLSIAGMLKEVMMVGVAHLIFGDTMSFVNACGLLVAMFGIGMYNWLKIHDALNTSSAKQSRGSDADQRNMSLDEVRQRQINFAGEPYDGLMVNMETITNGDIFDHDDDDANGGQLSAKSGVSSGMAIKGFARRRQSTFTNGDAFDSHGFDEFSLSSTDGNGDDISLPEIRPSIESGAQRFIDQAGGSVANSVNMDHIISQEHEDSPGATKLKHKE